MINIKDISDHDLIEGCLKDKRDFQEFLYRKYADKMYNVVMLYAKNSDSAADILQDAFIEVFRNLKRFRFESPLEAWIRRIMVNKALELYRREKRRNEFIEEFSINESPIIDDLIDQVNKKDIVRLVNELPRKAAVILKLYAIEGYQHNEIALKLGISEGTSKSQLNRARALLKQKLVLLNE